MAKKWLGWVVGIALIILLSLGSMFIASFLGKIIFASGFGIATYFLFKKSYSAKKSLVNTGIVAGVLLVLEMIVWLVTVSLTRKLAEVTGENGMTGAGLVSIYPTPNLFLGIIIPIIFFGIPLAIVLLSKKN